MCANFQQKLQRLSDLARGQQVSKMAELSWYSRCESLHHRPTVHMRPIPTLQVAIVKDGTDVRTTNRNSNGCPTLPEVNRCRRGLSCPCTGVVSRSTIAQPSRLVRSPTLQVAVIKNGTSRDHRRYCDSRSALTEINGVDEGANVGIRAPPSPNCPP